MNDSQAGFSSTAAAVILAVLFVVSLVFGFWAFSGRQDYKKNVDQKVAVAVSAAKKQQADADKVSYDALAKQPYKTFAGSATYGTITFSYPKTWSVYDDQTSSDEPINAYFFPGIVPGVQSGAAYPLRVELVSTDYSQVVGQYSNQVSQGTVKSAAYIPPAMASVKNVQPGLRFDGQIWQNNDGTMLSGSLVVLKVRDKTLEIYTQTNDSMSDFNNIVLSSLTFVP